MDQGTFLLALVVAAVAVVVLFKTAIVVPQQSAFIVERLGKYSKTLSAGFHILVPGIERIAYKHSLKESALDIPEQICITKDNVQVGIDGVLYLQVLDPARASYGISDYHFAISQLAQTTLRSEIGKIDLDRTFEERATINQNVVHELDKASEPWGVKVLRYEIRNINPPHDVLQAMEKQPTASSRSTKQPERPKPFSPSRRRRPKACGAWPRPSQPPAAAKRCSCASPRTTCGSSAISPGARTRSSCRRT